MGGTYRMYQAQLTLPATLARIQAARASIERAGGKVEVITTTSSLTIVRLMLPEAMAPDALLPGIPFFPL